MEYFLTFLEGFASFISPCILPLVPIYISYFMGKKSDDNKKFTALINACSFVLGFSLVFILMAVLASTLGIWLTSNMQYIKIAFGIILIFLGLDYAGLIKIKMPFISSNLQFDSSNLNIFKSFLFGLFFSISHAPCTGAFLASALTLIAKEQDILKGIILMIVYSIGIGIPFILSAVLIDKAKTIFNFIKKHYNVIKIISGVLLIIAGIYMFIS